MVESIPKLRPKIISQAQIDPATGIPSFDFTLDMATSTGTDVKEIIQDVLSGLNKLGKGLILAIDEFQKSPKLTMADGLRPPYALTCSNYETPLFHFYRLKKKCHL